MYLHHYIIINIQWGTTIHKDFTTYITPAQIVDKYIESIVNRLY